MWENIYTDVIVAGAAGGMGLVLSSIKKSVTKLVGRVDNLSDRVSILDSTVKEHTDTVKEIALLNSVVARIDVKIQQALEYLDPTDTCLQAFVHQQGEMAKDSIQWAIHTNLNLTHIDVTAKFESMFISVRDMLAQTPPEFSRLARPLLRNIAQHYVRRVIVIVEDKLFNSKLDRFFTLTEQITNEVLVTIIKTRIETQLKEETS